jgi:Uma2 family endonuclease
MIEPVFESIDTLTQAEFAEWVSRRSLHDTNRYELLNRRIVANPSPGYPHGSTVSRVGIVVGSFVRAGSFGECMGSSQGFELPSGDTVEPAFTIARRTQLDGPRRPRGPDQRLPRDLITRPSPMGLHVLTDVAQGSKETTSTDCAQVALPS